MSTETVNSATTIVARWPREHSEAALRLMRIHAKLAARAHRGREGAGVNDAVIILCGRCSGKMQWLAIDIGAEQYVGRRLVAAAMAGDRIETGPRVEECWTNPVCTCATLERVAEEETE